MSLFPCPDCRMYVSSEASHCPRCGYASISKAYKEHLIVEGERAEKLWAFRDARQKEERKAQQLALRKPLYLSSSGFSNRKLTSQQWDLLHSNPVKFFGLSVDWNIYKSVEFPSVTFWSQSECGSCYGRGTEDSYENDYYNGMNYGKYLGKIKCSSCNGSGIKKNESIVIGVTEDDRLIYKK